MTREVEARKQTEDAHQACRGQIRTIPKRRTTTSTGPKNAVLDNRTRGRKSHGPG